MRQLLLPVSRAMLCIIAPALLAACANEARGAGPLTAGTTPDSAGPGAATDITAPHTASAFPVDREWREYIDVGKSRTLDERAYNEGQRRTAKCMSRRGFDYTPVQYLDTDIDFGRLANPLNVAVAEKYGYHRPPLPSIINANPSDNAAFDEALGGNDATGDMGCSKEALAVVRLPGRQFFDLFANSIQSLDGQLAGYWASEAFITTSREWASCMGQRGFGYVSPLDPLREFSAAPSVSAKELQVRQADLDCDRTVGYTTGRSDWERKSFDRWSKDSEASLVELRRLADEYDTVLRRLEAEKLT